MIRYCKCETTDGRLCVNCGKGYHFSFHHKSRRYTGSTDNRCWRVLKRAREKAKLCEGHVEPWCECDACGATAPTLPPRELYYVARRIADGWQEVTGLTADKVLMLCPSCHGSFRVGLDWSLELGGAPLLSESIACAFAFQLGQYDADPYARETGKFIDPTHVDPAAWGIYGWGRWSEVRRTAANARVAERVAPPLSLIHVLHLGVTLCGTNLPLPLRSGGGVEFVDALADRGTWVRLEEWQSATCPDCHIRALQRAGAAAAEPML